MDLERSVRGLLQYEAYQEKHQKNVLTKAPPSPYQRQEAKKTLVVLRRKIADEFPQAAPEKALLRDEVLDLLIAEFPFTKDEWFAAVPREMRERTNGDEIRRYLDRVLETLADI